MSTSRLAVALAAGFFASTASVWSAPHAGGDPKAGAAAPTSPFAAPKTERIQNTAWPPAGVVATSAPADVAVRLERTSTGARRLVVEKTGTFVHLQYREVASAGPDWAAIELRAGDKAPPADVAVWESSDPRTLATTRGLVRFSLSEGARPEAELAEPPKGGPRNDSPVRTCQSIRDVTAGFAVLCSVSMATSGVRAIRPTSAHPLAAAWVWDVPKAGKQPASRFVRIDLPLDPGGAESAAIAYVHGGRGVVVRADATWPSSREPQALLFTEASRSQPVSPSFSWNVPPPKPKPAVKATAAIKN